MLKYRRINADDDEVLAGDHSGKFGNIAFEYSGNSIF